MALACFFLWALCTPLPGWALDRDNGPPSAPATLVAPGARISDAEARQALADVEAMLGHARTSRDLYARVLDEAESPVTVLLAYADRMITWGDFYRAEEIYQDHLQRHPKDDTVWLKLASLWRSCERYEEAVGIYRRRLFESPQNAQALLGLARVKRLQRRLESAGRYTQQFLELRPQDPEGLLLKGDIALLRKKHDQALSAYARVRADSSQAVPALLGRGKVRLDQGDPQGAKALFEQARALDPENVAARFHCVDPEQRATEAFVEAILANRDESPGELEQWARLYASQGHHNAAIRCYEASLQRDSEYFPSQIGLAEALAVDHRFEQALHRYDALAATFPENRKILMGRARTSAWARRYRASLEYYDRLLAISPADPVPRKEKARTAVWAKQMDRALATYEQLLVPPVDKGLASAVSPIAAEAGDEALCEAASALAERAETGTAFDGYEEFFKNLEAAKDGLSTRTWKRVEQARLRFLPAYRIQKGVSLEKQGKDQAWNRRFTCALRTYEDLTRFEPSNQEALMDFSQVQCALGLCNREAQVYEELLDLDPQHSLARQARKRLEALQRPSAAPGYAFWNEGGRDRLSAMERHRVDLALEVPVNCRLRLRVIGHHWIERPDFTEESFAADGFTLAASATLNAYLKGEGAWTLKDYRDDGLDTRHTGYARMQVNLWDAAKAGIGYERTDELYNVFGLEQGIQADAWWLSVTAPITRRLEVRSKTRHLSYTDDNTGQHYHLEAGYAFTDHPRLFKVAGFVEHRDTREQNAYHYQGRELDDITHPYWTPADYYAGGLRFEWHHDLSRIQLCRSRKHEYDLNLTLGTDTEHNPSIQVTGDWHWDIREDWAVEIQGLIHRSELWDAEGLWANLRYRF